MQYVTHIVTQIVVSIEHETSIREYLKYQYSYLIMWSCEHILYYILLCLYLRKNEMSSAIPVALRLLVEMCYWSVLSDIMMFHTTGLGDVS